MKQTDFTDPGVRATFESYPPAPRAKLLRLRQLILDTAETEGVGSLEETLKWGEPAYLTTETRAGTTIRIAWKAARPDVYAMYVHCQTDLIETFRELFESCLTFEGNRAVVFNVHDELPVGPVGLCVARALTYRRDRRKRT